MENFCPLWKTPAKNCAIIVSMEKIPLQQTKAWQKLQQDLNVTTFFLSENDGKTSSAPVNYQMLILKKDTPLGPYFYLPYGPYLRQKTYAKSAYEALRKLEKQEDVIFTRIEPENAENAAYWLEKAKKSKDLSPKKTWILDLAPEMDELYKNMKQNTRNLAKNYAKKGIEVKKFVAKPEFLSDNATVDENGQNLKILEKFLAGVAKNRHFSPIEKKTLKAEFNQSFASLFIAYYDPSKNPAENATMSPKTTQTAKKSQKIPIAASLFFDGEKTRYYMQSGTDENYRKLPGTYAILIEAIKDAKAKNLKNFDFWGVAPENAPKNHPWAGFTKFKKSFGGTEVSYAGTHDIIRKQVKYNLYKILRKINRLIRKI